MVKGGTARRGVLQSLRAGGLGAVRLLLLALALQLLSPVIDQGAAARAMALDGDLSLSICHDGATQPEAPPSADSAGNRHCVFCLPMMGGHAVEPVESGIGAPAVAVVAVLAGQDGPIPAGAARRLTSARDPPELSPTR